jgi:hypothetical protein
LAIFGPRAICELARRYCLLPREQVVKKDMSLLFLSHMSTSTKVLWYSNIRRAFDLFEFFSGSQVNFIENEYGVTFDLIGWMFNFSTFILLATVHLAATVWDT